MLMLLFKWDKQSSQPGAVYLQGQSEQMAEPAFRPAFLLEPKQIGLR